MGALVRVFPSAEIAPVAGVHVRGARGGRTDNLAARRILPAAASIRRTA
jgi:hypothetical protein